MATDGWRDVSRKSPCCVCGKPDWCTVSPKGTWACCMRIPSDKPARNGGYMHQITEDISDFVLPPKPDPKPTIDAHGISEQCIYNLLSLVEYDFINLADSLGVDRYSLRHLSVGWSTKYNAWTFPMRDARGRVVGLRLRFLDGRKKSWPGGKEGLFYDNYAHASRCGYRLYICEGPTDTAALMGLGLDVIGRPSCVGGVQHILDFVAIHQPREVVIVADPDEPGRRGARTLAGRLDCDVQIIEPPGGDVRDWVRSGAKRDDVENLLRATT